MDDKFVQNSFNFNARVKQAATDENTVHGRSHNSCVVDMIVFH